LPELKDRDDIPISLTETVNDNEQQLMSNGGRLKLAFAGRDKKQKMIDLCGISTNWFKNLKCPFIGYRLG
jgi:hypothetical protein